MKPMLAPEKTNTVMSDANGGEAIIQAKQLCVAYDETPAFTDISLEIKRRRVTALLGPSGCGKTSFLQCLNRLTDLIPCCCVSGELQLGGDDLLSPRLDVVALRQRVGLIFQKPNPFPMSIWRNLDLPLRERQRHTRSERRAAIEASLHMTGLWDEVKDRLNSPAQKLSGGQQQRLCIARALVLEPEVLLMDEPCSSLDPLATGVIEDLINRLRDRLTIVIVTHNLSQAIRISDNAALFWPHEGAGRIIEQGPTRSMFNAPRHPLTAAYVQSERG